MSTNISIKAGIIRKMIFDRLEETCCTNVERCIRCGYNNIEFHDEISEAWELIEYILNENGIYTISEIAEVLSYIYSEEYEHWLEVLNQHVRGKFNHVVFIALIYKYIKERDVDNE